MRAMAPHNDFSFDGQDRKLGPVSGRDQFLRKKNRKPLRERAADVLGPDSSALVDQLVAAITTESNRMGVARDLQEMIDNRVRRILRHAKAEIPVVDGDYSRRHKYVRACINNYLFPEHEQKGDDPADVLDNLSPEDMQNVHPDELKELFRQRREWNKPPFKKLEGRIGYDKAAKLLMQLFHLYHERWPKKSDRASYMIDHIMSNAVSKRYPVKYIETVIRNELQHARINRKPKRSGKKSKP